MSADAASTNILCPSCGAGLKFDPNIQGFLCEYCGSKHGINTEAAQAKEKDLNAAPKQRGWDATTESLNCNQCGATISISGAHTGQCPYCGSDFVKVPKPRTDLIRPEDMIPFKLDKVKAEGLFDDWIGKGWFRPSDLKNLKKLENIKGVYVPFWTYDCNTHSTWTADAGYYYYETEHYTVHVNGKTEHRTRQVQKVRWVPASGQRFGFYDDVLIVASKGLDRALVEKIYPYRLSELVAYKPEFLTGWMAEEYSIDVQTGWGLAQGKVMGSERSMCSRDVPGDTQRNLSVHTSFSNMTYKHVLLPLWIASYKYKEKLFHFMVNGQTGKIDGQKPWSALKITLFVIAMTLLAVGIGVGLYLLVNYTGG